MLAGRKCVQTMSIAEMDWWENLKDWIINKLRWFGPVNEVNCLVRSDKVDHI